MNKNDAIIFICVGAVSGAISTLVIVGLVLWLL